MRKNNMRISVLTAVIALLFLPFAYAGGKPGAAGRHHVEGEKQDNGLGRLPHYREWVKQPANSKLFALASHVPGEKLDSGLGKLPHYREWAGNAGNRHIAAMDLPDSR